MSQRSVRVLPRVVQVGEHGPARVLVAEDDEALARAYSEFLGVCGYDTDVVFDGRTALERLEQNSYDVVVTDIAMPHVDGLHVLEVLQNTRPHLPVIVMTATPDLTRTIVAVANGAFSLLTKPFRLVDLADTVRRAVESRPKRPAPITAATLRP